MSNPKEIDPRGMLRIGIVCPYGWDTPGGVQIHIKEFTEFLLQQGHSVSVIAPVSDDNVELEPWLVNAGRPLPIPFNGSIARVLFGPIASSRVRTWINQNDFDILHLHEPGIPSLSLLACWAANGPMVGTFHASTSRLRAISAVGALIEPMIEKLSARIAVSDMAAETMSNLYGAQAVVIPNGIDFNKFQGFRNFSASENLESPRIGFLGRFDEHRKGLDLLLAALPTILRKFPHAQVIVAGPGDEEKVRHGIDSKYAKSVLFLGRLTEQEKITFLSSINIYVAPNIGGESFGIILAEAMCSQAAIVASDIPAFSSLLRNGELGLLFDSEDSAALARAIITLLTSPAEISTFTEKALKAGFEYDWQRVGSHILDVYEAAMAGNGRVCLSSEQSDSQESDSQRRT
jgi:phosphatidylinositol alpha-mannosyltransferase